jgi:hypothetical protein
MDDGGSILEGIALGAIVALAFQALYFIAPLIH